MWVRGVTGKLTPASGTVRATGEPQVSATATSVTAAGGHAAEGSIAPDGRAVGRVTVPGAAPETPETPDPPTFGSGVTESDSDGPWWSGLPWRRIAVFSAVLFVLVIGSITAVELVTGRSVSALLHGEHNSSPTIVTVVHGSSDSSKQKSKTTPTPTPSDNSGSSESAAPTPEPSSSGSTSSTSPSGGSTPSSAPTSQPAQSRQPSPGGGEPNEPAGANPTAGK